MLQKVDMVEKAVRGYSDILDHSLSLEAECHNVLTVAKMVVAIYSIN
jgi:hypothetical protein